MPIVFGFYMAARAAPPLPKRIYLTYPPTLLARLLQIFWRFTRFTCVNHTP